MVFVWANKELHVDQYGSSIPAHISYVPVDGTVGMFWDAISRSWRSSGMLPGIFGSLIGSEFFSTQPASPSISNDIWPLTLGANETNPTIEVRVSDGTSTHTIRNATSEPMDIGTCHPIVFRAATFNLSPHVRDLWLLGSGNTVPEIVPLWPAVSPVVFDGIIPGSKTFTCIPQPTIVCPCWCGQPSYTHIVEVDNNQSRVRGVCFDHLKEVIALSYAWKECPNVATDTVKSVPGCECWNHCQKSHPSSVTPAVLPSGRWWIDWVSSSISGMRAISEASAVYARASTRIRVLPHGKKADSSDAAAIILNN
eukprot:c16540_g1_i1.p1 GENE.c16540_g1_i1~~c16540_g1_i1.p1  ORF type:complete len:310 (+),score=50.37 c16540_g1_i1:25-954(+)